MARSLTAGVVTELDARVKRPVVFFEGEFSGSTVRFWSGLGTKSWNGESWTGVGTLGSLSPITETGTIAARGLRVGLSGIPSALLSLVLGSVRRGLAGRIWLGFLDSAGAVIADPHKSFEGRLDQPEISEGGTTADIFITYENRLLPLERPITRRFTDEDQKIDFSADEGFNFVAAVQEWNGKWGAA
jgi:hypothetical protein